MDVEVTQEERERVTRPSHPKAPPTDRSRQQPIHRNINQWLDKGKAKGKDTEEAARERARRRRWERDHVVMIRHVHRTRLRFAGLVSPGVHMARIRTMSHDLHCMLRIYRNFGSRTCQLA